MHKNKTAKRVPSGMSLVELLVAMVVLAIGCLATMNLQANTIQKGAAANRLTVATFLAESKIEWLQSLVLDYEAVADVSQEPEYLRMDGEPCKAGTSGCNYVRTTTIIPKLPTSRSYEVSVKVEWLGAGPLRSTTLDTIISAVGF